MIIFEFFEIMCYNINIRSEVNYSMHEIEWDVTIIIPQNELNLRCSMRGDNWVIVEPYRGGALPASVHPTDLRTTNPQLLSAIVQTIKTATDAQIDVVSRDKNDELIEIINAYNETHVNRPQVTQKDIIRSIGVENYTGSYDALKPAYKGLILHEFKNIEYTGLTEYMQGLTLFVKFVTPGYSYLVEVESEHADIPLHDAETKQLYTEVLNKARTDTQTIKDLKKQGKI